jgi:hypothetical protein
MTRQDDAPPAFRGNGMIDDSVALALVAAARQLGVETAYEAVLCQAGIAFAPSLDLGEDCTSHWHMCAWQTTGGLPSAARQLGLTARRLVLPQPAGSPVPAGAAAPHQAIAAVQRCLTRGQVVLVERGWDLGLDPVGPHGFVHWGMMGLITTADSLTGRLEGAHLNGFTDNAVRWPASLWVLTRVGAPAAAAEADLAMLRLAIDRIRGQGVFSATERLVTGLQAVDAWARQMRQVPGFCASCFAAQGAAAGDAADNARRFVASSRAAARALRRVASTAPAAAARGDLERAADRYEAMAASLAPALSLDGGSSYGAILGDTTRQQAHADQVLAPMRRELAAVADDLDAAVVALTVRRLDGAVWVNGVPPAPDEGDGYVRGLEAILAQQGLPVTYERLMAWSGRAFAVQADTEHRWDGKVDVGWWPLDFWGLGLRLDFLAAAVGCDLDLVGALGLTTQQQAAVAAAPARYYVEQVQASVYRAIDSGRPVLCLDDWGFVVTGYDHSVNQPPVLGRCARDSTPVQDRGRSWPTTILVPGARRAPLGERAADIAALEFAVALAHDQAGPSAPEWRQRRFTGQRALAAWAALLRDPEQAVEDRHHANMQGRMAANRQAAVRFLRELQQQFVQEGQSAAVADLDEAIAAYGQVIGQLERITCRDLARNQEQRQRLAGQVDAIAATEGQAAAALARVLTALGLAAVPGSPAPERAADAE